GRAAGRLPTSTTVSRAEAADVPAGVVTVPSTGPSELTAGGDVAVIEVAELTVKPRAAIVPNRTAVAPLRWVPVMVTLVPPVTGPEVTLSPVTVGGLPLQSPV